MSGRRPAETLAEVTGKRFLAGAGYAVGSVARPRRSARDCRMREWGRRALQRHHVDAPGPHPHDVGNDDVADRGRDETTGDRDDDEVPAVPPVTVTETFPAATETLPARVVTVTKTETLPVTTETLPATTETLPAATVTTTAANPAAAVAAGAAVASSQETEEETPWGWIAFGILAAAVVVGGIVWWLRRRSARKDGGQPAPPADRLAAEALDDEAVPQAAVAHRELVAVRACRAPSGRCRPRRGSPRLSPAAGRRSRGAGRRCASGRGRSGDRSRHGRGPFPGRRRRRRSRGRGGRRRGS